MEDSDWWLYSTFWCRGILQNVQSQVDQLSVTAGEAVYFYKFSNSSAFRESQWLFCTLFIDFEGCFPSSTEVLAFFTWILYFNFCFSGTTAEENAIICNNCSLVFCVSGRSVVRFFQDLARYLPDNGAQNVDLCVIHGQLCCLHFLMPKGGTSTPSQKIT